MTPTSGDLVSPGLTYRPLMRPTAHARHVTSLPGAVRRHRHTATHSEGYSARVGEGRCVAAGPAEVEVQRLVVHAQLVGDELFAVPVVAGDDAGHALRPVVPAADAHAEVTADAQPLTAPRVVDVDGDRSHRDELARLPGPREVRDGITAVLPGEDGLERGALLVGRALVQVEDPGPRRS